MNQQTALHILKSGRNVFLTGGPGTGKTYVLNQFITWCKQHAIPIAVTASTGLAATHLSGTTIHSWSGIGIKDYLSAYDLDAMSQKQILVTRLQRPKVLVLDEISMIDATRFSMIDEVCRTLRGNREPFGGLQVVVSGDFFQLPPVQQGGYYSFAFQSEAWKGAEFRTCYLETTHRHTDSRFHEILEGIRAGNTGPDLRYDLKATSEHRFVQDPTMLCTHNRHADAYNQKKLAELSGPAWTHSVTSKGRKQYVQSLLKSVLVAPLLELKKGALVMFVKNNPEKGYYNGMRGTVIGKADNGFPEVETLDGEVIVAEPAVWSKRNDEKIEAEITQVPLCLAWAITVHKSQGMTLDAVDVDLSQAFVAGQGYVALSRATSLKGLRVRGMGPMALEVDESVRSFDRLVKEQSSQLFEIVSNLDQETVDDLSVQAIERFGGSQQKVAVTDPVMGKKKDRISTQEITRRLLADQHSLQDIADERELQLATILNHLELLLDQNANVETDHIDIEAPEEVVTFFLSDPKVSLKNAFKKFKGKFDYETLRLGRLVAKIR